MNLRYILSLLLILATCEVFSQELLINVSLKQPKILVVNAGNNILAEDPQNITIGEDVTVTGGTPEYTYSWSDTQGNNYESKFATVSGFGSYWLTVTDANNCSATDSMQIINNVGIYQPGNDNSSILFPNPASGSIFLPLQDMNNGLASDDELLLSIVSSAGNIVFRENITVPGSEQFYEIFPGKLSPGSYTIIIEKNKTRKFFKIIWQ